MTVSFVSKLQYIEMFEHVRIHQGKITLPTLGLKPRGCVTRSQNKGISGPTKRTHVLQTFTNRIYGVWGEGYVYIGICLFTKGLPLPRIHHWSHDRGMSAQRGMGEPDNPSPRRSRSVRILLECILV